MFLISTVLAIAIEPSCVSGIILSTLYSLLVVRIVGTRFIILYKRTEKPSSHS